jgi:hypothetical protein
VTRGGKLVRICVNDLISLIAAAAERKLAKLTGYWLLSEVGGTMFAAVSCAIVAVLHSPAVRQLVVDA